MGGHSFDGASLLLGPGTPLVEGGEEEVQEEGEERRTSRRRTRAAGEDEEAAGCWLMASSTRLELDLELELTCADTCDSDREDPGWPWRSSQPGEVSP